MSSLQNITKNKDKESRLDVDENNFSTFPDEREDSDSHSVWAEDSDYQSQDDYGCHCGRHESCEICDESDEEREFRKVMWDEEEVREKEDAEFWEWFASGTRTVRISVSDIPLFRHFLRTEFFDRFKPVPKVEEAENSFLERQRQIARQAEKLAKEKEQLHLLRMKEQAEKRRRALELDAIVRNFCIEYMERLGWSSEHYLDEHGNLLEEAELFVLKVYKENQELLKHAQSIIAERESSNKMRQVAARSSQREKIRKVLKKKLNANGGVKSAIEKKRREDARKKQLALNKIAEDERKAKELKEWEALNLKAQEQAKNAPKFSQQLEVESEGDEGDEGDDALQEENLTPFKTLYRALDEPLFRGQVQKEEKKVEKKEKWTSVSGKSSPVPQIVAGKSLIQKKRAENPLSQSRERTNAFESIVSQEKKSAAELVKTRLCRSVALGTSCKFHAKCTFAHSVSELQQTPCRFGARCKNVQFAQNGVYTNVQGQKLCEGFHTAETPSSYYNRIVSANKPQGGAVKSLQKPPPKKK